MCVLPEIFCACILRYDYPLKKYIERERDSHNINDSETCFVIQCSIDFWVSLHVWYSIAMTTKHSIVMWHYNLFN